MKSLNPVNYGNHNNIHLIFRSGSKKKATLVIRLVVFFDDCRAHVTSIRSKVPKNLINFDSTKKDLISELDKFDFELELTRKEWNRVKFSLLT